jgi:hypothetical protein
VSSYRVAWSNGETGSREVRVGIESCAGQTLIVLSGSGRSMSIPPHVAAQLASGIDAALARIGRNGHEKITAPAGSSKTSAPVRQDQGASETE